MSEDLSDRSDGELREFARSWLAANLPSGWMAAVDEGDDDEVARLRAALDYEQWCVRLGEDGLATPTWPAEYGAGLSLEPGQARSVNEVLEHYRIPRSYNVIGIGMGGPTVLTWGSEALKQKLVRRIATGEDIWCQMFSEPGAGSDVAGLSTQAVRDGDEWRITGQKVWTSLAHVSSWGMLLARTDPEVPKHAGLTYFVIDMKQPGVEVRPLAQMTGDAEFNEVFFDDARIPDEQRLGPVGDGWRVAITTLMNERIALSGSGSVGGSVGGSGVDRLVERHRPITDPLLRQRVAQAHIDDRVIRWNNQRAAVARRSGEAGPEGSVTKLQQAEFNRRLQELAIDMELTSAVAWDGPGFRRGDGMALTDDPGVSDLGSVVRGFLRSQANTIEGGTSAVMRNILGERVLQLPKEPDPSRDLAWKDVPRSS